MAPSNSAAPATATAAKKYKLFSSSAASGEKAAAPCAFFASPQGCRNGANCKFSHELQHDVVKAVAPAAAAAPNGGGSVVSSESSEGDDNNNKVVATCTMVKDDNNNNNGNKKKQKTKANKMKGAADDNPFLAREEQQETAASSEAPIAAAAAAAAAEQPFKSSSSSSKWVPLHRSSAESKPNPESSDGNKKEKSNSNNKKKNRRGKKSATGENNNNPFVNPKGGAATKKAARTQDVKETLETNTATKAASPPPPQKSITATKKKQQKSAAAPPTNTTTTTTSTFTSAATSSSSSSPSTSAAATTGIHPAFSSLNLPVAPFFNLPANNNIADSNKKKQGPKINNKPKQQQQQEALESGEEEEAEDQKPATTKRPEQDSDEEESNNDDDNDHGNNNNSSSSSSMSGNKRDPKKEKYLNGVWPESTAVGRKWLPAVRKTRQHFRYLRAYDFEKFQQQDEDIGSGGGPSAWVRARPYNNNNNNKDNSAKNNLPAAIAIDCEMCETQDPVSKKRNPRALCRISVINAENDELLLDSLVKPAWPVINHRSWINGIAPQHLEMVQFTLRHAQAFLMELCTDETVILGHAVHNDLAALQMEHYCVVDSACLFQASDSERATVSLKDLAWNILNKKMPETHDSVNDARVALRCLEHYMEKNGNVDKIVRSNASKNSGGGGGGGGCDGFGSSTASFAMQLFVHRIPRKVEPDHLMKMFLEHSSVEPESVQDVDFPNPSNPMGKTIVTFRSQAHANLAFETLAGKSEPDPSGRLQKKVFMKNGSYIRVRKMAYECKPQQQQQPQQESQQDSSPLKRKRSDSM